jgi:VanZ family protein
VLMWMTLIFCASTGAGAPKVSSYILRPLLYWLDPTMSPETFDLIHTCTRKMGHLTEYAGLGYLTFRMARREPLWSQKSVAAQFGIALLICALYASSDEFHQSFVPTRHSSVIDVLIDTTGAAIGIGITCAVLRLRRRI